MDPVRFKKLCLAANRIYCLYYSNDCITETVKAHFNEPHCKEKVNKQLLKEIAKLNIDFIHNNNTSSK